MAGRQCFHCKEWVPEGAPHDCWTTTEAALTRDLSEDLRDAWERLRETAAAFGDQRIYASHHSIMFARRACYFFVRPKRSFLELCVFLPRPVHAPQIRRVDQVSRSKYVHVMRVRHRDEVEAPITDWLQEAYAREDAPEAAQAISSARAPAAKRPQSRSAPGTRARGSARATPARSPSAARRSTERSTDREVTGPASSKQALYERARQLGVEGRSTMSKQELARAVGKRR